MAGAGGAVLVEAWAGWRGPLPAQQVVVQNGADRGGGLGSVPAVPGGPTGQPVHDDAVLLGRVAFPGPVGQALPQDAADVLGVVQADA